MPGHSPGHNMPDHDPDHTMPAMCSMNMLFTWDYNNVCVVFKWWHIRTKVDLVLTVLAIIFLASLYELLKSKYRSFLRTARQSKAPGTADVYYATYLRKVKVRKALYYGLQVGYSFLLMLVFMTYNGWLMIAVAVGAALGNFVWGTELESSEGIYLANSQEDLESLACH